MLAGGAGMGGAGAAGTGTGGGSDGADAAPARIDGGNGAGGTPTCTTDVTWYKDDDGDGYGTTTSFYGCPAPPGSWALVNNDCNDANPLVNPGQKKFFGVAYAKADQTDSFDYDCSGTEEPNPSLTLAPEDCGLLKLALCGTASGYETNTRSGLGINPWCGSTTVRVCVPSVLVCMVSERLDQPPFSCR